MMLIMEKLSLMLLLWGCVYILVAAIGDKR